MSIQSYDYTGHRVVVVGGTRGTGHAVARAFADSGADVVVTGTMMLRELYDGDLTGMTYEMVNLARQDSIDHFVSQVPDIDVLVNAAGCNLPYGLPDSEAGFISEAVRTGVLGPAFLTTRLRLRLGRSHAPGSGLVLNTAGVARWFELFTTPQDAVDTLTEHTRRSGEQYAGIGTRVNSVLEPTMSFVPRQVFGNRTETPSDGDLLVRPKPSVAQSVADTALFLASPSAARITGQTIRLT